VSNRVLLLWCLIWSVAFGVVEGAVVVYLRALAYPDGFVFPLQQIDARIMSTELVRELATLVMLLAVARLATRGGLRRFAVFALCFAVWDLTYYGTLRVLLGWPASVLDWDILFLIPVPWTGPVLAPVLVSLALIAASVAILLEPEGRQFGWLRPIDWALELLAGALILASFFWNAGPVQAGGLPQAFPWWLFLPGWTGGLVWFILRWRCRPSA
jgi:hypothetical protein